MKFLAGSAYTRFADAVEKHIRMKDFWEIAGVGIFAILFFLWNLSARSEVIVTHDQARTYAAILAQVIPVLLLALYVESTTAWSQTQAVQRAQRMKFLEIGRSLGSAREKAAGARKADHDSGTTSSELDQADLINVDTAFDLATMLADHKTDSDSEGVRAVLTVLQLFIALMGEALALFFVLAPSRALMGTMTGATLLLLFLFGQRLLEWPRAVSEGRAVQLLSRVMSPVLLLAYVAAAARTTGITVTG